MRVFRTELERRIWQRRQSFEEFAESAEAFAREHGEPGTLGVRHLQRLVAGRGQNGRPLGPVRPATARLLEHVFDVSIDELLAPPAQTTADDVDATAQGVCEAPGRAEHHRARCQKQTGDGRGHRLRDLGASYEWLDVRAGWIADTSRRKVSSRVTKVGVDDLVDRHVRRSKVSRHRMAHALSQYYGGGMAQFGPYSVRMGHRRIDTSVLTCPDWLGLACLLVPESDQVTLVDTGRDSENISGPIGASYAVNRLAEVSVLDVCMDHAPLYRLLDFTADAIGISGHVSVAPFIEYALTMDLLEGELVDALAGESPRVNKLPLRDRYLPDLASVLDLSGRFCAGGVLALCAIARPSDPYRGGADYALLVQERSGQVLNGARRLSVIPKGFHQPLKDVRADAHISATLRREMEEELFGRSEVDGTSGDSRVAAPMHPNRLSEPMRWLTDRLGRMRMECTGFGLNLVSGNYEFASLIVIEDEEFWTRYGNRVEANWEASGLRLYSSLDSRLVSDLVADESWSNEGLFALLEGLRRLREIGGERVDLPPIEVTEPGRS
jgi:hypothetical protein